MGRKPGGGRGERDLEKLVETHGHRESMHKNSSLRISLGLNQWPWSCISIATMRSVDDTVNMGVHYTMQHLGHPGTYARILFLDFSSAFNTIVPRLFSSKLSQLNMSPVICQWITSFLTDRK